MIYKTFLDTINLDFQPIEILITNRTFDIIIFIYDILKFAQIKSLSMCTISTS